MATFLVTANIPELWNGVPEVVTIDGILPSGRHFIQDPAVRVVDNITSADILCHVTEEEFAAANRAHDDLLEELGRELNRIHGVERPTRFWLILLGPWLRQFTHVVFCRWYTLCEVLRRYPDLEMRVVDAPWQDLTPQTHDEASLLFFTEPWNSWIYAVLLRQARGEAAVTRVAAPAAMAEFAAYRADRNYGLPRPRAWSWWKRAMVRALARLNRRAKGVVYATVFSRKDLLRFFWHLRLIPQVWDSPIGLRPWPIEHRSLLASSTAEGDFARALAPLVSLQLPAIYLEGFSDLTRASASLALPAAPRFAFSHNAYLRHDAFKLWAADHATSTGTRLVGAQHGGGYCIYHLANWAELHERAAVDLWIAWSDQRDAGRATSTVSPLDDTPLRRGATAARPSTGLFQCLIILPVLYRQSIWLGSNILGAASDVMSQCQQLVNDLLTDERINVTVRIKSGAARKPERASRDDMPFGSAERLRISDKQESPLSEDLATADICVVMYPDTAMGDVLASGVPMLLLWNPRLVRWKCDLAEVEPSLRRHGVLFSESGDCGRQVKSVLDTATEWWQSVAIRHSLEGLVNIASRPVISSALSRRLALSIMSDDGTVGICKAGVRSTWADAGSNDVTSLSR